MICGLLSLITAIMFLASSGMTTYAMWYAEGFTLNWLVIGQLRGRIIEEYEQGQSVGPGATVRKKVQVLNDGHVDMLARVRIEKAWGLRAENGTLVRNNALPTNNIEITFNDVDWLWIDGEGDEYGFFYYQAVLAPGELSSPLMEYFHICNTTDNRFSGMDADIIVFLEVVQAGGDGVTYWGFDSLDDLGIVYDPEPPPGFETYVIFINPEQGFFFPEDTEGNLFANFQNMVPGEQRRQPITIDSRFNESIEIFLRADVADQIYLSEAQLDLINRLLREYAVITILHNGGVIYDGPVWGNLDYHQSHFAPFSYNGTMRENISLGVFGAGETKAMYVDITLSTAMRNEFMELMGRVQWVLSAHGGEEETTTTTAPTTTTEEPTTTGEHTTVPYTTPYTTAAPTTTAAATTTAAPTTTEAPPTATQPEPPCPTKPEPPPSTTTRPATVPQTGLLENGDLWFMIMVFSGSMSLMFFVMWRKLKKRHDQVHEEFMEQNA